MKPSKLILGSLALACSAATAAEAPPVVGNVNVPAGTSSLQEEKPVGEFGQPSWVMNRRFSTTRVHIQQDPWELGFEQWWRGRFYDGGESKHRFQTEVELGLPYRMQLDLYENIAVQDDDWEHETFAVELRWALADWNAIPLNPTLYFEYKFGGDEHPDVIEPKILFGGELAESWHWGLNFIYERETSGEETEEWAVSGGISKTLVDEKFSIGLEAKYTNETVAGDRDNPAHKLVFGPSIQWRPCPNSHLDFVPMAGLTDDSPNAEIWFIFGIDFGGMESPKQKGYTPTSVRDN